MKFDPSPNSGTCDVSGREFRSGNEVSLADKSASESNENRFSGGEVDSGDEFESANAIAESGPGLVSGGNEVNSGNGVYSEDTDNSSRDSEPSTEKLEASEGLVDVDSLSDAGVSYVEAVESGTGANISVQGELDSGSAGVVESVPVEKVSVFVARSDPVFGSVKSESENSDPGNDKSALATSFELDGRIAGMSIGKHRLTKFASAF